LDVLLPTTLSGGSTLRVGAHATMDVRATLTIDVSLLHNFGRVELRGGGIDLISVPLFEASIRNAPGSQFLIQSNSDVRNLGGGGLFINQGLLRKEGGFGDSRIGADYTDEGNPLGSALVDVLRGTLTFEGSGEFSSDFKVALDGTLVFYFANFHLNTPLQMTGDGVVKVSTGAYLVAGPNVTVEIVPQLQLLSGALRGPGIFLIDTDFRWLKGGLEEGALVIARGTTQISGRGNKLIDNSLFINVGDLAWTGDTGQRNQIQLNNGTIRNFGTFDMRNDGTILSLGVCPRIAGSTLAAGNC
jgi:hypothetical protein